ncbi:YhcN/YlaJ family sporulation lipoprotein [Evansella halocellulosilytica]|uniref:YhcN/YlaJ family sporulation lipoprotein n=1 Tax=Evansella halocellulosilytica TaxID=2011013 RepID=UPI0015CEC578|nr:YhcN/YlaJ family sporulation lipoprotein [Evansella halocellulosilytica]
MNRMSKSGLLLLLVVSLLVSCQTWDKGHYEGSNITPFHNKELSTSQNKAMGAKDEVEPMKEVERARALSVDDDIYVALTVTGFQRFFLNDIRKKAYDRIQNKYKKENIHVSTDRKIDIELRDIERELQKDNMTKEQLKKRLKKVEDDMKG